MMTPEELQKIQEALEGITPGNWYALRNPERDWTVRSLSGRDDYPICVADFSLWHEKTAHFIAHAPGWVADLLYHLQEAQAQLEAIRAVLDGTLKLGGDEEENEETEWDEE